MQHIISNAGSYALMLGIENYLPQEANIMKYLQQLQNKVNQFNTSSCQAAASLVGGLWPKTKVAQKQVCETIGTNKGIFSDWAAAKQGCGAGGQSGQVFARGASDKKFKNMLLGKGNLAWQALMQNNFTRSDTQLAELMMSLSGSLIINNQGGSSTPRYLASLVNSHSLVKALLYGGSATIYGCDTMDALGCLNPKTITINIRAKDGLANQVKAKLQDMVSKVQSNQALTPDEIGLLNSTRLPIYKMLNVQAAYSQGQGVDVSRYSDLIATNILYQYLDESLQVVQESAHRLSWPTSIMRQFLSGVNRARTIVRAQKLSAWQEVAGTAQLIAQTQQEERQLAGYLSSDLSGEINWAGGLN